MTELHQFHISATQFEDLARLAWEARERAFVIGPTKVGCAVLAEDGQTFLGCNVEHRFRSHDVHAEVNALTTMVAAGQKRAVALVIAAERELFTPCGACVDWIMQLAGPRCIVGFQARPGGPITKHSASDLMPFYPS